MSYNRKSVTTSIRIDREALAVLEWWAGLKGFHLRQWIREDLQERAEKIAIEHNLDFSQDPFVNPDVPATVTKDDLRRDVDVSDIEAAVAEVVAEDRPDDIVATDIVDVEVVDPTEGTP